MSADSGSTASMESAATRALRQTSWLLQQAGTFNGQGRPPPKAEEDTGELQRAAGDPTPSLYPLPNYAYPATPGNLS